MYIFLANSDAGVFDFTQGQQLINYDIIMVKIQFCNIYLKISKSLYTFKVSNYQSNQKVKKE